MRRPDVLDQIRRILLLAVGQHQIEADSRQLDLAFGTTPERPPAPADLEESCQRAHALILELILLIQMESAGLIASPLAKPGRRRLGLGSDPPLRLLGEWEWSRPTEDSPWMLGAAAPEREKAFAQGLSRVRMLAESSGLAPNRVREITRRLYPLASRALPEDDLPGLVHGHGLRHRIRITRSGKRAFQADGGREQGLGVVHTPAHLAAELTAILVEPVSPDEPPDVLDPACGSGQFLLAAARNLVADVPEGAAEDPKSCAARLRRMQHLHGVDIDPCASRLTAWNLSYWAARRARACLGADAAGASDTGEFLDGIFGRRFPYFLGDQIQVGNSLQVEASSFSPGFLWEKRYPMVFERSRPGFDVVTGNPPWISFGQRGRSAAPEEERLYYERLFPSGTQYKLSIYPLFMELALRLCREGGRHGYLVPDSLLSGYHFSRIRRLLLSDTDLLELTLLESGFWPGLHVGHTVLYAVRKKGPDTQAPVSVRNRVLRAGAARGRANGPASQEANPDAKGKPAAERKAPGEVRPAAGESVVWVPSFQYAATGSAPLRIFRDFGEMAFLSRMETSPLRFRDVAWTYSGLIARHGQKSIQADHPVEEFHLREGDRGEAFSDPAAKGHWRKALLSGGEVVPYGIRWRGGWVYLPEAREALGRLYKSGFDLARYAPPKVFLRQTGDRLIAAVDREGYYCLNNLHLVGDNEGMEIPSLMLAGMLMSGPIQQTYKILSLETARPLAQVDLKTVEALPYPVDSTGFPVGAGPAPPRNLGQSRKILRTLDRTLRDGEPEAMLEMAAGAWKAGPTAFAGGPLSGREVLNLILGRILEMVEGEVDLSTASAGLARADGGAGASGGDGAGRSQLGRVSGASAARRRHRRAPDQAELQAAFDAVMTVVFQVGAG